MEVLVSESGNDIITAVQVVRRFCEDVGRLLKTAKESMDREGWRPHNSQALASSSTSLNYPTNWVPQDAFCFLFNKQRPLQMAVISVVFDSIDDPEGFKMPRVMYGHFRYREPVRDNWAFRWARLGAGGNLTADGTFRTVELSELDDPAPQDVELVEMAALPLHEVTGAEIVERRVVRELVSRLQG
jgi:hypothetical protein